MKIAAITFLLTILLSNCVYGQVARYHYPFNGNARDTGFYRHHGMLTGDYAFAPNREGIPNSSIYFWGLGDMTSSLLMENPSQSDISIEFWYKSSPYFQTHGLTTIVMAIDTVKKNTAWAITKRHNSDGTLSLVFSVANTLSLISMDTIHIDTAWNHIVFTYQTNDGLMKGYVNGVFVKSLGNVHGVYSNHLLKVGSFAIGAGTTVDSLSLIDDLKIYNECLTEVYIKTLVDRTVSSIISQYEKNPTLHIYPNPACGFLRLDYWGQEHIDEVRIKDVSGRELMKIPNQREISILSLSRGIYSLELYEEGLIIERKYFVISE